MGLGLVVGQGFGVPDVVRSLANEPVGHDGLAVFMAEAFVVEDSLGDRHIGGVEGFAFSLY